MKCNKILPYLFLLTMLFESKAQQGINIANETEINTSFQEYSPTFYKGGLVFITSNPAVAKVKQSDDNTGKGTTSIFLTKQLDNGLLSKPTPFAESLTTSFYDGPLCFNPDGTMVYFTRSNLKHNKPIKAKDGLVKLKIYSAQLKADKWENIVELPFNNKEYDFTHPSVSPDGRRLYFASNRPGGFGGMDLYVVTLIDNKWSEPVNLGPKINTPKDEVFPFIHEDGKVFYSSNGRAKNVGGLDIYFTAKTDTGWLMPHLLPEPINSRSDDFGLILSPDKMSGYYSSNRSSGKGDDDIYSFNSTQTIDSEFVINNELSNTEGVETKNNIETTIESPTGEVKSIEKTNTVASNETAQSKPVKDTVAEVQTQVGQAKSELVKLENPIIESAKTDVVVAEKPSEKPVEKTTLETAIAMPKEEPVKEVVAIKEEVKTEKPVEKTTLETAIAMPKEEPVKEVVTIKEEVKTEKPVEKAKEETKVPTPKVEPVKEIVAIKEELKTENPVEITAVSVPKEEPVKEIVAIKEEIKSEMPIEKTKVETVVTTSVVEPTKETIVKTEVLVEKTETVKEKPLEIKVVETTPSVSTPNSDKTAESTLASNKVKDVKMVVGANLKKETSSNVRCKYLVVVGTYADEKNAIIQQKIVKNKGYADVEVIHYKDKNLYGVCVKQSNDEKEAYSVAKTVAKGGIDAFVKVLK
jgi:WD40-like Beta Propeller Repeat/SPOR domain